jgi:hypothetical protein
MIDKFDKRDSVVAMINQKLEELSLECCHHQS